MITNEQACNWLKNNYFTASDIDCTTAVVLKILDNKCKMGAMDQLAVLTIYDVTKKLTGLRLDENIHRVITDARTEPTDDVCLKIHELRVKAEEIIDKPTMKTYKSMLRKGLFSLSESCNPY